MHDRALSSQGAVRRKQGILAACTVGNFVSVTPTVTAVLSLFLVPISNEFGWARSTVSGVLALLALIAAVVIPTAGRLADKYGARPVIITGHLIFAASLPLLALANSSVLRFYLLFTIVGIAAAVPTQALFSKVISEWFDANRALCLAFSGGVGNGVGVTVMPMIAGVMLVHYGWRGAFVGMGLIVFSIGFPVFVTLLRDRKAYTGGRVDGPAIVPGFSLAEAMHNRVYWLMLAAVTLGAGCLTALFTHIVPLLTDRGFSPNQATTVLGVSGLTCAGWQILVGSILDRSTSARILVPMFLAAVCGVAIFQFGHGVPVMLAGGLLIGVGLGTEYGGLPYLLSRYFGMRAFGAIVGTMFGVITLVQGVAPYLFDAAFDHFGSYREALQVVSGCLLIGSALLFVLPRFSTSRAQPRPKAREDGVTQSPPA